jgi:hypothetical protein
MIAPCIDPTTVDALRAADELAADAQTAIGAGSRRTTTNGRGTSFVSCRFTCTGEQAIQIRVALCVLASQEIDAKRRGNLLAAERAIADAMPNDSPANRPGSPADGPRVPDPSQWVVMAGTRSALGALAEDPRWRRLAVPASTRGVDRRLLKSLERHQAGVARDPSCP